MSVQSTWYMKRLLQSKKIMIIKIVPGIQQLTSNGLHHELQNLHLFKPPLYLHHG